MLHRRVRCATRLFPAKQHPFHSMGFCPLRGTPTTSLRLVDQLRRSGGAHAPKTVPLSVEWTSPAIPPPVSHGQSISRRSMKTLAPTRSRGPGGPETVETHHSRPVRGAEAVQWANPAARNRDQKRRTRDGRLWRRSRAPPPVRRFAGRRGLSKVAAGSLSRVPRDRGRKSDLHGVSDVKERAVRPLGEPE